MKGLGVDELCQRVGIDKIRIQFLHECATQIQQRKGGVAVTFYTRETTVAAFAQDDPERIGMVVWMPYADFRRAQADFKAEQAALPDSPEPTR